MREVYRRVGKRIWSIHTTQDEAVSPVVATILMIAVTVVLATAVYFLVSYYTTPSPLLGSLTDESPGSLNYTSLQLSLASPTSLKNPSDITVTVFNGSHVVGSGWTVLNASITSGGKVFYMHTFTSRGDYWSSTGVVSAHGASIQTGAIIYIQFHSASGRSISPATSGMKVVVTYDGYSGSIPLTLNIAP